jgi:L-cysteine/cystine lyase
MIIRPGSLVSAAVESLRAQFPALAELVYLNAGTNGPVPGRALVAAEESLRRQAEQGRSGKAFMDDLVERGEVLRGRVAALIGAELGELALTGSTTDGVNSILTALDLRPGDEIVTSDEEHPGVLGPLAAARDTRGVRLRVAPFHELAAAVEPRTRLVACSHVSWKSGRIVDHAALAATGVDVLLDGAQGLGAVPVDVRALGCHYYAASGQKWLCGPNGIGYLFARADRIAALRAPWPGYHALEDPGDPLHSPLHGDARRLATGFPAPHQVEWALAALDVLEEAGIPAVHERGCKLASRLAERLAERGVAVAARGRSTLVAFEAPEPATLVERLTAAGLVLRDLPGGPYVRASVGAWNREDDLERLVAAVTG